MDSTTLNLRPPLWLPVLVAVIAGGSYIAGKKVETRLPPATITVSGESKAHAQPDIAQLQFGITTQRQKTAQDAVKMLSKDMTLVVDALKDLGIEDRDIATQSLNLRPSYDYLEGKRVNEGFEANQNLTVKVRDIDRISEVLDSAVRSGANQVGSVNFTIDDPDVLREQARAEAIEDAQERAQVLADQLGKTLGDLKGYHEGGGGHYPQPMMARMEMMGGGLDESYAPPIPAGEEEIVVTVNLTYEVR